MLADDRAAFLRDSGVLPADGLALADQGGARADRPAPFLCHVCVEPDRDFSAARPRRSSGGLCFCGGDCGDAVCVVEGWETDRWITRSKTIMVQIYYFEKPYIIHKYIL